MTEVSTPDNDTLVLDDIVDGGILRLTLNAPKSRNALSEAMMSALSAALADAAADDADAPRPGLAWGRLARGAVPIACSSSAEAGVGIAMP